MKCSFNKVCYFHRNYDPKPITTRIKTLAIDSEANRQGKPFMFCLSDGSIIKPPDLLDHLFSRAYRGVKFVCFNLKYDEGAILYDLPQTNLNELREFGKTEYDGYRYRSIPKKELTISKGHKSLAFYDIAQFYGTSLNKAAIYYLGKSKDDLNPELFTDEYVRKHWDLIARYCVQDCKLTQELTDLFIDILIKEFGIYPQKLYSTGYIAGIHFSRTCDVIHIRRYWRFWREMTQYAYEAYAGGKFECYQRGFGKFYQYDINSAYPNEIANLKDISKAEVIQSNDYQADADYGWLKCKLLVKKDYSPVPVKDHELNFYPSGSFTKIITKVEYDHIIARGGQGKILKGYWLKCPEVYPYRAEVNRLFKLKRQLKVSGDKLRYLLIKTILNAFYGKFIQITPKFKGDKISYEAGYLFNPFYASYITANVRVRLSEVCADHPDSVCAVHTDSVITTCDLSGNGIKLSGDLGDWSQEQTGDGVIVGCGVYQVGDKSHYRGFKVKDFTLSDIISSNKGKHKITIDQKLVLSWRLVVFRNADHNQINRFIKGQEASKTLHLNFDNKRDWDSNFNWRRLVNSKPRIYVELDKETQYQNWLKELYTSEPVYRNKDIESDYPEYDKLAKEENLERKRQNAREAKRYNKFLGNF